MVALAAVLLAGGCSEKTGGTARPAAGSAAGPAIARVMLDGAALAKLLAQPFKSAPVSPPSYGGSEKLATAYESATPADCIGVVFMMEKGSYQSAPVQNVASETWVNDGPSVKVADVAEGVISFATPKDAAAAFARFSAQWQGCDGTTLNMASVTSARNVISDVRVVDSVLAASVMMNPPEHSILLSEPLARAIGIRDNSLVEVAVRFYGNDDPTALGSGDIHTSAVDIVHAMLAQS
jgi:PknH-like extracellular domain